MKPNAKNHNPDPAYLRRLMDESGLTQKQIAEDIGISERLLRMYTILDRSAKSAREAPYTVQFAIESLSKN